MTCEKHTASLRRRSCSAVSLAFSWWPPLFMDAFLLQARIHRCCGWCGALGIVWRRLEPRRTAFAARCSGCWACRTADVHERRTLPYDSDAVHGGSSGGDMATRRCRGAQCLLPRTFLAALC
jgi:hypothetical protein